MDAQKPTGCTEEFFKNNLRLRVYQFRKDDGFLSYMVEVVARNAWAGQDKIIFARGGIDLDSAKKTFQQLTAELNHYDWMEGEIVMEDEN